MFAVCAGYPIGKLPTDDCGIVPFVSKFQDRGPTALGSFKFGTPYIPDCDHAAGGNWVNIKLD